MDPKGAATCFQGIRGYISVMATSRFTYCLIKGIIFCSDICGTFLMGVVISYDRLNI